MVDELGLDKKTLELMKAKWPIPFSAADLLAEDLPEQRWAVPGILPEGATILAGKPKIGKSFLALSLAVAVAQGGSAFGGIAVEPGRVLYLALEDVKRRLQDRIGAMVSDVKGLDRLEIQTRWPRLSDFGDLALAYWLKDHPEARLVVVDTLALIRTARRGSGPNYEEDYADMVRLKRVADDHGVSMVLVTHQRKQEAEDDVDSVSGSAGLTGAADGFLVLKKTGERYLLSMRGRDVEEREIALSKDRRTGLWTVLGDPSERPELLMSDQRLKVLKILGDAPCPLGPKEVAASIGSTYGATKVLLGKMVEEQQLVKLTRGRYTTLDHAAYQADLEEANEARSEAVGTSGDE